MNPDEVVAHVEDRQGCDVVFDRRGHVSNPGPETGYGSPRGTGLRLSGAAAMREVS
jgi:hypothetical protein